MAVGLTTTCAITTKVASSNLAYGSRVDSALKAGKVLGGSVIDMRFVKPLDEQLISQINTLPLPISIVS
jgi:deoxyxylulose-5-phosphate synthase